MRTTVVTPLGLVSQPNKYGQYAPGACSLALNVCLRDPGVLSSLPDVRTYRADVISSGHVLGKMWPGASSVLTVSEAATGAMRWVTSGASNTVTFPNSTTMTFSAGKTHAAIMRDRWIVTNDTMSPIVFDSEGDTSSRRAGIPAPEIHPTSLTATNAQALATASTVAYRAIIRRGHSDGYETISAPSGPIYVTNSIGTTRNPVLVVELPGAGPGLATAAEAGDIVEVYRSKTVASGSSPGDTLYLAVSYVLTAGDITAKQASVTDNATPASLSTELYTNPGQETVSKAKSPPPLSSGVAVFKGFTFYNATRLRSYKKLKIPGPTGALSSAAERATGIGSRATTGDVAIGSFDILNVADMTGVAVGQQVSITGAMNGATVTAIVGTTVTTTIASSVNAVGTAATFSDVLVLNGSSTSINTAFEPNVGFSATGARVIYDGAPSYTFTAVGTWTMTFPPTFIVENAFPKSTDLTIRATNGANYYPELPDYNESDASGTSDPRTNRYMWSLDQQPEAVPPLNYAYVGAGTLYRMTPTRDALYMWCSDGLFRLSGDGGQWRTDPVDPRLVLAARNAVDTLDGKVWAYTNEGLVAVSDYEGVQYISRDVIGDAATLPGAVYSDTWDTFLACDELHHEVWLTFRSGSNSVSYVYNTQRKSFCTVDTTTEWSCMAYSSALRSLVIGSAGGNPDVLYFEDDTSTTRMSGADVRFQPITVDDPNTVKQFIDCDYIISGASSAMTLVPSFDGTNYAAVTVPASSIESRASVPVPRNAPAIAERIAPGFTFSSGATTQAWSFRGLSVRSVYGTEEGRR